MAAATITLAQFFAGPEFEEAHFAQLQAHRANGGHTPYLDPEYNEYFCENCEAFLGKAE